VIADPANDVFLSAASAWEIGVKFGLGKLSLPVDPILFVPRERTRHRLTSLAVDEIASLIASTLPVHHKDPFDRLLIGQALSRGLTILTPDPMISSYDVPVLWS
jgi:PIN domain nuclease of toxin-antitoxin system